MVKAAQVDLIRSSTVCPGKYMILIAGDTGDVKASMAEGIKRGGECVVDTLTPVSYTHLIRSAECAAEAARTHPPEEES